MPLSLLGSQMDALLLQNVFLGQFIKCGREVPLNHNILLALEAGTASRNLHVSLAHWCYLSKHCLQPLADSSYVLGFLWGAISCFVDFWAKLSDRQSKPKAFKTIVNVRGRTEGRQWLLNVFRDPGTRHKLQVCLAVGTPPRLMKLRIHTCNFHFSIKTLLKMILKQAKCTTYFRPEIKNFKDKSSRDKNPHCRG